MTLITRFFVSLALWALLSSPGYAEDKTVTLNVDGMTCESCPYMVSKAIKKLPGVKKIDVTLATRKAVVIFDDALTSVEKITDATFEAGFPSKLDDGTGAAVTVKKDGPKPPRGSHK